MVYHDFRVEVSGQTLVSEMKLLSILCAIHSKKKTFLVYHVTYDVIALSGLTSRCL